MHLVCLDLEGVLVPEIWIEFAQRTGIEELKLTTRDVPDYDFLMKKRIEILKKNFLTLKNIQDVISEMEPLEGAFDFVQKVREKTQLIILSDTFEEFALPLMKKLNWPTILCNKLVVSPNTGMIEDYLLRQQDGKRKAVEAFSQINVKIFAAGDSYNDLTMIKKAHKGCFFRPPQSIAEENPTIEAVFSHEVLLEKIEAFLAEK